MLTAKEIKDKAERSYKDFLISVLRRDIFFPYHIKGNKGNANLPLQDLYPALKHLIDNSKEKLGYGYSVTFKEVNTRHSGIITMPDAVFFENPPDFLKFIEKEVVFLAFRKATDLTRRQVPSLLPWIENNVLKCQKYADEWADFLKIVVYFIQNAHNSKPFYWRQLPIAVDLPAFEIHQNIIGELLDAVLPTAAIQQNETQFEPRFGLLFDEWLVRIRFASFSLPNLGRDVALPVSVLANWTDINCENIFFVTDKNVFLSFPNTPLSIIVLWEHSSAILTKIMWFQSKNTYFIGDITPSGFEKLSEMRFILMEHPDKVGRGIKSLMMDKMTFDAFPQHQQTLKMGVNMPVFLTHLADEEQTFYSFLINLKEKNSLLQRDISYSFLKNKVKIS
jgi:hypothetical protein